MKTQANYSPLAKATRVVLYVFLFGTSCYLFYMQAKGSFMGDTSLHLNTAISDDPSSYSFIGFLIRPLYSIAGYWGFALLLSAVTIGTVYLTERLIGEVLPTLRPLAQTLLSFALITCIAIHLPFLYEKWLIGTQSGNLWHNPTYEIMRFFALAAILCYLRITKSTSSSPWWLWVGFCLSCIIATLMKPSFIVVFAPTVVVLCVIDLLHDRKTIKRSLGIGLCFLFLLAILAYQYLSLYGSPSDGSSIAIGFADVWLLRRPDLLVSALQSFAFPLIVLAGCANKLKHNRNYLMALIMFLLSLAEYLFLYESGPRMTHGNFGWSLSFGLFYLNIVSAIVFLEKWGDAVSPLFTKEQQQPSRKATSAAQQEHLAAAGRQTLSHASKAYVFIAAAVFLLHLISGIAYYCLLLSGISPYN